MQPIKIESIAQDDKKITFIQGKLKFGFWRTKQDGSETKAFAQFKKYGFQVGDTVQAEVKEEPATFTDGKGKTVNFTRRTILYFQEIENVPVVSVNKEKTLEEKVAILWEEHQENERSNLY